MQQLHHLRRKGEVITDESGKTRRFKGTWFSAGTPYKEFLSTIATLKPGSPLRLEIKESDGSFVDFDEYYLQTFKPYGSNTELPITENQLNEQKPETVHLKIIRLSNHHEVSSVLTETVVATTTTCSEKNHLLKDRPPLCVDALITLCPNTSAISFVNNLNHRQRDQYETDAKNAATGKQTGYLSNLQGDKHELEGDNKNKSVLPTIKIRKDLLPHSNAVCYKIRGYILYEICRDGIRTFYYHPQYELVTEEKSEHNLNYICIPFQNEIFTSTGMKLKMKVKDIVGTKTHPPDKMDQFFRLTNTYSTQDYETNRIACVLECNDKVLQNHLALSESFVFAKKEQQREIPIINDQDEIIERISIKILKRKNNVECRAEQSDDSTKKKKSKRNNRKATSTMNVSSNVHNNQMITATQNILTLHSENSTTQFVTQSSSVRTLQNDLSANDYPPVTTAFSEQNSQQIPYRPIILPQPFIEDTQTPLGKSTISMKHQILLPGLTNDKPSDSSHQTEDFRRSPTDLNESIDYFIPSDDLTKVDYETFTEFLCDMDENFVENQQQA